MTDKAKFKDKVKDKVKVKVKDRADGSQLTPKGNLNGGTGSDSNFESTYNKTDKPTIEIEKPPLEKVTPEKVEPVRVGKVKLTVEELFSIAQVNKRVSSSKSLAPFVPLDTVPYISFIDSERISIIGLALDILSLYRFQNIEIRYIKNKETNQKALYLSRGGQGTHNKFQKSAGGRRTLNLANTEILRGLFGGSGNYNRNVVGTKYLAEKATINGVDYLYVNLSALPIRRLKRKKS